MPRLDHIALEVSDMDRALEFYTDKMGFVLVSREIKNEEKEEFCFLKSDGTSLELISDMDKSYGGKKEIRKPYCPHVCFETDDMERTIRARMSTSERVTRERRLLEMAIATNAR